MSDKLNEIKVSVILKEKQRRENNRYEFTHSGEKKLIISNHGEYFVNGYPAALASFNWDEVKEVYFNGTRILESGEDVTYRDKLVKCLTNTNKAFLHSNALESGDKIYGKIDLSYQTIIDDLTPVLEEIRQCIMMLEILKQKRAT